MSNGDLNWIAGFIWNIADDVLRDVYVRGKYRDVILPMTVIRRLDAVLEPTKEAVLKLNKQLDDAGIANKQDALCQSLRERLLQHLPVHPQGPPGPGQAAATQGRLRGLPGRLFAQRPGDSGKIQVPQPDHDAGRGRQSSAVSSRSSPPTTSTSVPTPCSTRTGTSACPAWTTTPWARSSRS